MPRMKDTIVPYSLEYDADFDPLKVKKFLKTKEDEEVW